MGTASQGWAIECNDFEFLEKMEKNNADMDVHVKFNN